MENKEVIKERYMFANREAYISMLELSPADGMIKIRKLGGSRSSKYVPIEAQEGIADKLFREWNVLDLDYSVVHNELLMTVKIQYLPDYPGADYQFCSGVGAKAIQQKQGENPEGFPKGKIINSLEYCLPAAKSNAVSNALSDLGNVFGKNLNRDCDNDFKITFE